MTLENQVCSLELAKKLKELGVKQESHFYWGHQMVNIGGAITRTGTELYPQKYGNALIPEASAFTVAELGEMLPWMINNDSPPYYLEAHKMIQTVDIDEWEIVYARSNYPNLIHKRAYTETDARAKMLIYLLENNLTTL